MAEPETCLFSNKSLFQSCSLRTGQVGCGVSNSGYQNYLDVKGKSVLVTQDSFIALKILSSLFPLVFFSKYIILYALSRPRSNLDTV